MNRSSRHASKGYGVLEIADAAVKAVTISDGGRTVLCVIVATVLAGCGGTTTTSDAGGDAAADAADSGPSTIRTVTAGANYTCAVTDAQTVACWGEDDVGQVGDGADQLANVPKFIGALAGVVGVTLSPEHSIAHSCAWTNSGDAYCWGDNEYGQIGNGETSSTFVAAPTKLVGLPSIAMVACGGLHTCALTTAGTVYCTGEADRGELGIGAPDGGAPPPLVSTFTAVQGLPGPATAIGAGDQDTCAIVSGAVYCFGLNVDGRLGDGSNTARYSPTQVQGLSGVTAVAVGTMHTCALSGGQVYCWGNDTHGELGDGKNNTTSSSPVLVQGVTNAIAVSAGAFHTCALESSGAMKCWGSNALGQLGDGSFVERDSPVLVAPLGPVSWMAAGELHSCAVLQSGAVECWGDNQWGELGNGQADGGPQQTDVPTAVVGLP